MRTPLVLLALGALTACFDKPADDDDDDSTTETGTTTDPTVDGTIEPEPDGLSQEDYVAASAEQTCDFLAECDLLEYYGGSYDACVTEITYATNAYLDSDLCDYDPVAALACLEAYDDSSCEGTKTSTAKESPCEDIC